MGVCLNERTNEIDKYISKQMPRKRIFTVAFTKFAYFQFSPLDIIFFSNSSIFISQYVTRHVTFPAPLFISFHFISYHFNLNLDLNLKPPTDRPTDPCYYRRSLPPFLPSSIRSDQIGSDQIKNPASQPASQNPTNPTHSLTHPSNPHPGRKKFAHFSRITHDPHSRLKDVAFISSDVEHGRERRDTQAFKY